MGPIIMAPTAYGPWIDVSYYDDNNLSDQTVIDTAIMENSGKTLLISKPFNINDNIVVPSNITIIISNAGSLTIASGKTFTVNGICITNGRLVNTGSGIMKYGLWCGWSQTVPNNVIYAKPGSMCLYTTSTTGKLYIKESGDNTNTGWVLK
jgi:hypothetical protein